MPQEAATALDDAAPARRVAAACARVDSAAEAELYRRLAPAKAEVDDLLRQARGLDALVQKAAGK